MTRDILELNVTAGSSEPLVCVHKSVRAAEVREVEECRRAVAVLFEIILLLTQGSNRD